MKTNTLLFFLTIISPSFCDGKKYLRDFVAKTKKLLKNLIGEGG